MTADTHDQPGRASYTTVDITLFKTTTTTTQHEHTSFPGPNRESKPYAQESIITEIFDDNFEEEEEEEEEVRRLLEM